VRDFVRGIGLFGRGLYIMVRSPRLLLIGAAPAVLTALLLLGGLITLGFFVDDLASLVTPFADNWVSGLREAVRIAISVALFGAALVIGVLSFSALTLAIGGPFYEHIAEKLEDRLGLGPSAGAGRQHRVGDAAGQPDEPGTVTPEDVGLTGIDPVIPATPDHPTTAADPTDTATAGPTPPGPAGVGPTSGAGPIAPVQPAVAPSAEDLSWGRLLWLGIRDGVLLILRSMVFTVPMVIAGFVPVVGQTVVPVLMALTTAWFLALELVAVSFYRRGMDLEQRRAVLSKRRALAVGFGLPATLLCAIPLVSIVVMPIAFAGGVLLADEALRDAKAAS
jgi:uncharacterized protein involved in cysteine biosynthesis